MADKYGIRKFSDEVLRNELIRIDCELYWRKIRIEIWVRKIIEMSGI